MRKPIIPKSLKGLVLLAAVTVLLGSCGKPTDPTFPQDDQKPRNDSIPSQGFGVS